MLWVLIRSPQSLLMNAHNMYFCGQIRKNIYTFRLKKKPLVLWVIIMNCMIELQRLLSKVHMFLLNFLYEKFTCMILLFLKATTCIYFFFVPWIGTGSFRFKYVLSRDMWLNSLGLLFSFILLYVIIRLNQPVSVGLIFGLFLAVYSVCLNPGPATPRYALPLQCSSRPVGFTDLDLHCLSVYEFVSTTWIKQSDWLNFLS